MHYKNIVFDIDGTLLDTEYAVLHSMQDTLANLWGKEYPIEELKFALGITGVDALQQLGIEDIPQTIDLWNETMVKYADTVTLFPGIKELLESLSELGCSIGIVTSRIQSEFEKEFYRLGILPYFQTVVCADDTEKHKPDAAPLLKYMELSGADRQETLYVGDSQYDGQCAENAGIDFSLAVWGSHSRTVKAKYYLEEPDNLLSVV